MFLVFGNKKRNLIMFWDKVAILYDLFETIYNKKVYYGTGEKVAEFISNSDVVLECACGTGAITKYIVQKCKFIYATDFSDAMLKQTSKKCKNFSNIIIEKADITNLKYCNNSFDAVVAGNVIHLLSEPAKAFNELKRITKPGGEIIIPTYINASKVSSSLAVKFFEFLGANFKRQFDLDSYKIFFKSLGCENVDYFVVEGRMPCAIAVIYKK